MTTLQRRGEVRSDLDPKVLGQVLFDIFNIMRIEFLRYDGKVLADLRATVARQMRPLAHPVAPS